VQVPGIVEHGLTNAQRDRRDEKRERLIATHAPVGAHLVIEGHDLASIVGAEEHQVAAVGLLHERFHSPDRSSVGPVNRHRARAGRHLQHAAV
jgi:hypothetical protein